jgi:hypothetical protein
MVSPIIVTITLAGLPTVLTWFSNERTACPIIVLALGPNHHEKYVVSVLITVLRGVLHWACADPVIKIAIEPKSKADLEKMGMGLSKLAQEDPSFHFTRDEETNQTVIEGMGELHLDIIVDRLRREYKV